MTQEKTYFTSFMESFINPGAETNENLTIFSYAHLKFFTITNWECSMWSLAIYIVNCSKYARGN